MKAAVTGKNRKNTRKMMTTIRPLNRYLTDERIHLLYLFARLPLPLGVVGHEGSTVLVCLNGLRLLAFKQAQ